MPEGLWLEVALGGVFGLLIGSFLNVVIYRLPKMMERQWAAECAEMTGQAPPTQEKFNLLVPRSRCQKCGHQIRWYENVPVLSYLFLRGKCSACATPISPRYPLVELVTGLLFAWCVWHWGWTLTAAAWCVFAAVLVALTLIDWDTTLLPDDLTLPLLWLGLLAAASGITGVRLADAVWGAAAGYLSLWLVYWGFKLLTGKEGMGFGDFKLYAALGAWFGASALIPIILLAAVIGAVIGILMKMGGQLREGRYVPFGPFLALGGAAVWLFGAQELMQIAGLS